MTIRKEVRLVTDIGSPGHLPGPEPDPDFDAWTAWLDREIDAGRSPVPPEREPGGGLSISLGDASDIDPQLLAVMCGPDGLGGQCLGQQFGQDAPADALRPGPVLAALAEQSAGDLGRLDDDQLIGVLRASQRLANREAWRQTLLIAEFARRRETELAAATARGVPVHCREGEFPGEELAAELRITGCEAAARIETAQQLTARLPATLTAMAGGLIDARRAAVIADYTATLTATDVVTADQALSAYAAEKRVEQLARKAAALEMKLAPEAVRARKERERKISARVEVRREMSGNASLAGREMDTATALASKAHIDAIAARLRTPESTAPSAHSASASWPSSPRAATPSTSSARAIPPRAIRLRATPHAPRPPPPAQNPSRAAQRKPAPKPRQPGRPQPQLLPRSRR